eukprot:jgi/Mesvir1/22388/Mv17879-RA.1
MYGGYDDHDREENDQFYMRPDAVVPDVVKTFVVYFYRHIREKNVAEIHQMYEGSFAKLTERYFKASPWPLVDAIAPLVDNDHVFCLLYKEMYFRHIYAKVSPSLAQRCESWDNYCSLFQVILHGNVNMQLPNQWLFDMIDEFIYQFQSFSQYRSKLKTKTDEELALLKNCSQVWNVLGVLNFLQALVDKADIVLILNKERASGDTWFTDNDGYDLSGGSNVLRVLGYASLIGLCRVHCLLGDYHGALRAIEPVDVFHRGLYQKVPQGHIAALYYAGFSYMMLCRYEEAATLFNSALVYISRAKHYHTRMAAYDQILKKNEQIFALLAMCIALCPAWLLLEEAVSSVLRDKYGEKMARMQRMEEVVFDELFAYGCPKFVCAAPPTIEGGLGDHHQEAFVLQLKLFLAEIRQQQLLPAIRSYLKLYSTITISKLADLMEVEESVLRTQLLCLKAKAIHSYAQGGGAQRGTHHDVDFFIDGDMVHVADTTVQRNFEGEMNSRQERSVTTMARQRDSLGVHVNDPAAETPCEKPRGYSERYYLTVGTSAVAHDVAADEGIDGRWFAVGERPAHVILSQWMQWIKWVLVPVRAIFCVCGLDTFSKWQGCAVGMLWTDERCIAADGVHGAESSALLAGCLFLSACGSARQRGWLPFLLAPRKQWFAAASGFSVSRARFRVCGCDRQIRLMVATATASLAKGERASDADGGLWFASPAPLLFMCLPCCFRSAASMDVMFTSKRSDVGFPSAKVKAHTRRPRGTRGGMWQLLGGFIWSAGCQTVCGGPWPSELLPCAHGALLPEHVAQLLGAAVVESGGGSAISDAKEVQLIHVTTGSVRQLRADFLIPWTPSIEPFLDGSSFWTRIYTNGRGKTRWHENRNFGSILLALGSRVDSRANNTIVHSLRRNSEGEMLAISPGSVVQVRSEDPGNKPFFLEVVCIVKPGNVDNTNEVVLCGYWLWRDDELPEHLAQAVHWSRTVIELIASEDCAAVPVSAVQDIVSVQAYWQADFFSWADYTVQFFYCKENACLQRVRGPAKMKELKAAFQARNEVLMAGCSEPTRRTLNQSQAAAFRPVAQKKWGPKQSTQDPSVKGYVQFPTSPVMMSAWPRSILKRFKAESDGTTLKAVFESPTHDAAKPLAEVLGRLWWVLRYGGDGHVELQREITILYAPFKAPHSFKLKAAGATARNVTAHVLWHR